MIQTTGLKGLYNRISVFSQVLQKDVVDVTMFTNEISTIDSLASIRVMMASRTTSLMMTGRGISPEQFKTNISDSQKVCDSQKIKYQLEFNTTTDKIGEGYRKIGNIVMLLSRADFHIKNGHDLFPYEYIQILLNNGAML